MSVLVDTEWGSDLENVKSSSTWLFLLLFRQDFAVVLINILWCEKGSANRR